jgi:hypothetical protein
MYFYRIWLSLFLAAFSVCFADLSLAMNPSISPKKEETQHSRKCPICLQKAPLRCSKCHAFSYCSKEHQTQDWKAGHKEECSRICSLKDAVSIQPSLIPGAGRGLFAQREFEVEDPIAIYDGPIHTRNISYAIQHGFNSFEQNIGNNQFIAGRENPIAPHLAGQLANDAYVDSETLHKILSVDCKNLSEDFLEWAQSWTTNQLRTHNSAQRKSNAAPVLSTYPAYLLATRDIHLGEEILSNYGPEYWLGISRYLCHLHGLPAAGFRIQRAVSAGAEAAGRVDRIEGHITKEVALKNIGLITNHIQFRISTLILPPGLMQIAVLQQKEFDEMVRELGLEQKLEEIAELPNSEFYGVNHWGKPHPKSRKLFLEMLDYSERMKNASGLRIFQLVNGRSGVALSEDDLKEMRLMLSQAETTQ